MKILMIYVLYNCITLFLPTRVVSEDIENSLQLLKDTNYLSTVCTKSGIMVQILLDKETNHKNGSLNKLDIPILTERVCCTFTISNVILIDDLLKDDLCITQQSQSSRHATLKVRHPIIYGSREEETTQLSCSAQEQTRKLCDHHEDNLDVGGGKNSSRASTVNSTSHVLLKYLIPYVVSENSDNQKCQQFESRHASVSSPLDLTITFEFAPIIAASNQSSLTVRYIEQKVTLVCQVHGYPEPIVVWRKNGLTIQRRTSLNQEMANSTLNYTITTQHKKSCNFLSILEIVVQDFDDLGHYFCTAYNAHGNRSTSFHVRAMTPVIFGQRSKQFNVTGFIIGMMPPLLFSFYFIMKLGYRSRYAIERPEDDEHYNEQYFVGY